MRRQPSWKEASWIHKALASLFGICFLYTALVTAIQSGAFDRNWYHAFYLKEDLAENLQMPEKDLDEAIDVLVDYVEGKRDNIDFTAEVNGRPVLFYNEKELDHMKDVRLLWKSVRMLRNGCLPLLLLLLCYFYSKKEMGILLWGTLWVYGFFLVFLLMLALWFILDFTSLWSAFHRMFFTNDLWLLDPAKDRMIWLCPESMFSALIVKIALLFALFSLTALFVEAGLAKWVRKKIV